MNPTEPKKLALELKVILDQEFSLLENLLEVMQAERELLVRFQPEQLLELNKHKELLVLQHSYVERDRVAVSQKLANVLGIETPNPPLRVLVKAVDGEPGKQLAELHSKLSAVIDAIQELNELNRRLIEFSIHSVKNSVAFLKKRFFSTETYNPKGVINEEIRQLSSVNSRA